MTDLERKIKLADILMSYANTHEAVKHVTYMTQTNDNPKDYILALADGLLYGNWPWINYSKQAESRINRPPQNAEILELNNIDPFIEGITNRKNNK